MIEKLIRCCGILNYGYICMRSDHHLHGEGIEPLWFYPAKNLQLIECPQCRQEYLVLRTANALSCPYSECTGKKIEED